MKTLMVAALAVAAVGANVAFAEEDDGIVSAAPVVADPVNPQPGMLANAYNIPALYDREYKVNAALDSLVKSPSVKSYADTSTSFSRDGVQKDTKISVMKWEGYIKCKRATSYTFSFDTSRNDSYNNKYSFYVNGRQCIELAWGQKSIDVDLKLGWNKVVIVATLSDVGRKIDIKYRPKGSLSDPRPLSPSMMFYDKPVEEEW